MLRKLVAPLMAVVMMMFGLALSAGTASANTFAIGPEEACGPYGQPSASGPEYGIILEVPGVQLFDGAVHCYAVEFSCEDVGVPGVAHINIDSEFTVDICYYGVIGGPDVVACGVMSWGVVSTVNCSDDESDEADDDESVADEATSGSTKKPARQIRPICVNSTNAYDKLPHETRVGDVVSYGRYDLLVVDGMSCQFGCHDGWDMNCDDVLGDFCPVENDRRTIGGAYACMTS